MAQTDLERLTFQLSADMRKMQRDLDKANGVVGQRADQMQRRMDKLGAEMGRTFGQISLAAGAAFGAITAYAIKAASDAEEVGNAFRVAFGDQAKAAEEFAKSYSQSVGRSFTEVQGNMARSQLVLTGIGVEASAALEMVKAIQGRAVDIGSLFNVDDAEAFRAVMSGIAGEAEPMKRFGVAVNDAAVKSELLRLGFKGSSSDATEAQKAIARLNIILAQSAKADGDAARTKDGLANSTKAARAEFEAAAVSLGKELLPAATAATKAAAELLKEFNALPSGVKLAGLALLGLVAAGGPITAAITGMVKLIQYAAKARIALAMLASAPVAGVAAAGLVEGAFVSDDKAGVMADRLTRNPSSQATKVAQIAASDKDLAAARGWYRQAGRERANPADVKLLDELIAQRAAAAGKAAAFEAQKQVEAVLKSFQLPTAETPSGRIPGGRTGGGAGKPKPDTIQITIPDVITIDSDTIFDLSNLTDQTRQIEQNPDLTNAPDGLASIGGAIMSQERYDEIQGGVYDSIRGGLEAGFQDGIPGVMQYLAQALQQTILDSVAKSLTEAFMGQVSSSGIGAAVAGLFGFRAAGGPVSRGRPYIVGEKGPELMVPGASGTVIPNNALRGVRGMSTPSRGGGVTIIQPFHLHAEGAVMTAELLQTMDRRSKANAAMSAQAAVMASKRGYAATQARFQLLGST
ncbi:MAG: hypothetical protein WAW13_00445 [Minisyncoccia bacterium]